MNFRPIKDFKNEIRSLSREKWVLTHDPYVAEQLVREAIHERYNSIIATFLIALFIRLAVELIVYWFKKHILDPDPVYQFGEPGYED